MSLIISVFINTSATAANSNAELQKIQKTNTLGSIRIEYSNYGGIPPGAGVQLIVYSKGSKTIFEANTERLNAQVNLYETNTYRLIENNDLKTLASLMLSSNIMSPEKSPEEIVSDKHLEPDGQYFTFKLQNNVKLERAYFGKLPSKATDLNTFLNQLLDKIIMQKNLVSTSSVKFPFN